MFRELLLICLLYFYTSDALYPLSFVSLFCKAHADGSVVALSVDGENVGKKGRMREELRNDHPLIL